LTDNAALVVMNDPTVWSHKQKTNSLAFLWPITLQTVEIVSRPKSQSLSTR